MRSCTVQSEHKVAREFRVLERIGIFWEIYRVLYCEEMERNVNAINAVETTKRGMKSEQERTEPEYAGWWGDVADIRWKNLGGTVYRRCHVRFCEKGRRVEECGIQDTHYRRART